MKKIAFKKACEKMKETSNKVGKAYKMGIDLNEFMDSEYYVTTHLWEAVLTEKGYDWFAWFMYEKAYLYELREDMKAHDEHKNEICQDLDSLYDYLVTNNYFNTPIK
jgi:hypothetical protein